ncbi:MAG: hypothetical protein M3O70_23560, partial [Actinomycetota bacterium]|nr:hypothetical protein [Actinomycetota bacterium]
LYRAFDFSISACGYNSYHELVGFALPALFVPNVHTALDDQLARARYAERVGVGQSWEEPTPQGLERAVAPLLDDRRRTTMAERCGQLRFENGAGQAAALIADLLHAPVNVGSQGTST